MKFQGFIGGSYKLDSVNVDCQRSVNLYPEIIESGFGKGGQQAYLKSTPALSYFYRTNNSEINGPTRLAYCDGLGDENFSNRAFFVFGKFVYSYQFQVSNSVSNPSSYAFRYIGSINTTSGPLSAASIKRYSGSITYYDTVIVDGENNYLLEQSFDSSTGVKSDVSINTFSALGYTPVLGATSVVWSDGYLIYNKKNTNQFYVSDLQSPFVSALSFSSAEGDPDSILELAVNRRDVYTFNERSIEVYQNTGNADFPFERAQGGFIEVGLLAAKSVAKTNDTFFWLGRSKTGQGAVYAMTATTPQRISTPAIEKDISSYVDPTTATAYSYEKDGHIFYVLNFAEKTWVYDLKTQLWHERASLKNGILGRHRGDVHCFYPDSNQHLVGDFEKSYLYFLDENSDRDYDDQAVNNYTEIPRIRTFPHISGSLKNMFFDSLQIDMETGVGRDGSPFPLQGVDPKAMLRWSDDGGHTWSNEKWVSVGKIGNYKARAIWRRLGKSRDRVFELRISDSVRVTLIDAEIEVTQGVS